MFRRNDENSNSKNCQYKYIELTTNKPIAENINEIAFIYKLWINQTNYSNTCYFLDIPFIIAMAPPKETNAIVISVIYTHTETLPVPPNTLSKSDTVNVQ